MKRRIVYAVPAESGAVIEKTAKPPKKAPRARPRSCPECGAHAAVPAGAVAGSVCDSCRQQEPLW